jgi:hypothetical protein
LLFSSIITITPLSRPLPPNGVPSNINIYASLTDAAPILRAASCVGGEEGDLLRVLCGNSPSPWARGVASYADHSDPQSSIQIFLSQDAFNHGEYFLASVLVHELAHAKHLELNRGSNISPVDYSHYSEYAAYSAQIRFMNTIPASVMRENPALKRLFGDANAQLNNITYSTPIPENLKSKFPSSASCR